MSLSLVVLTGAGISAESGLSTFRDAGGIWSTVDVNDVATPEGFARDPARVLDFYNARRARAAGVRPNAAHLALAALQARLGAAMTLVTQNVDNLHEAAGHDPVIHMHGAIAGALCAACGARWAAPAEMRAEDPCPACTEPATRPDVVWFGEVPYHMERIEAALARATHFAAIGTSGQVWPAAGFAAMARARGAVTAELTLEPSGGAFDEVMAGRATETVPAWAEAFGR